MKLQIQDENIYVKKHLYFIYIQIIYKLFEGTHC